METRQTYDLPAAEVQSQKKLKNKNDTITTREQQKYNQRETEPQERNMREYVITL